MRKRYVSQGISGREQCASDVGTFAFARISGGMILSGPKACRGSTKDARILAAFLHSPAISCQLCGRGEVDIQMLLGGVAHTPHIRGQEVVDAERHLDGIAFSYP